MIEVDVLRKSAWLFIREKPKKKREIRQRNQKYDECKQKWKFYSDSRCDRSIILLTLAAIFKRDSESFSGS